MGLYGQGETGHVDRSDDKCRRSIGEFVSMASLSATNGITCTYDRDAGGEHYHYTLAVCMGISSFDMSKWDVTLTICQVHLTPTIGADLLDCVGVT